MADRVQILCITKADRFNPDRHITHIGGKNHDATRWKITEEEAIAGIEAHKWEFYTSVSGRTVDVVIETSSKGRKFLKTEADSYKPDNLLSLPECP